MRIRYDNQTKKITAIDAPDWVVSDDKQTVVDIGDTPLPEVETKFIRFGTDKEPFVIVKDTVEAEEHAQKEGRKNKVSAILAKLKLTREEFLDLRTAILEGTDI